jgi:ribosomal protein S18 acetylase RimI-like enzyme
MVHSGVIDVDLALVQPSQLFISQKKLDDCTRLFLEKGFDDYEPIPIKRIGNDLFLTDGHTRAFVLWQNGLRTIKAVHDTDDLDWIMYLVDLKWCRDAGIRSIGDLGSRVIPHADYERRWIDRCGNSHAALLQDPLADLEIEFETDPEEKRAVCDAILRSLPKWFGIEEAIVSYANDVRQLPFVTSSLYGKVIGFCAIKINFGVNAELYVLGLFEEFHGRGIGARMLAFVERFCRQREILYMTVKTLSHRDPDPNYAKTRKFYERCGFRAIEEFPSLWGEANPCLYMLKEVGGKGG